MATIAQNDAQIAALGRVNELLDEVKQLNDLLTSKSTYSIRVGRKTSVSIDPSYNKKIESVLTSQRKSRIAEINTTVAKFRLVLSEKEEALLSEQAVKTEAKAVEVEEEPYYGDEDDVDVTPDLP